MNAVCWGLESNAKKGGRKYTTALDLTLYSKFFGYASIKLDYILNIISWKDLAMLRSFGELPMRGNILNRPSLLISLKAFVRAMKAKTRSDGQMMVLWRTMHANSLLPYPNDPEQRNAVIVVAIACYSCSWERHYISISGVLGNWTFFLALHS